MPVVDSANPPGEFPSYSGANNSDKKVRRNGFDVAILGSFIHTVFFILQLSDLNYIHYEFIKSWAKSYSREKLKRGVEIKYW